MGMSSKTRTDFMELNPINLIYLHSRDASKNLVLQLLSRIVVLLEPTPLLQPSCSHGRSPGGQLLHLESGKQIQTWRSFDIQESTTKVILLSYIDLQNFNSSKHIYIDGYMMRKQRIKDLQYYETSQFSCVE